MTEPKNTKEHVPVEGANKDPISLNKPKKTWSNPALRMLGLPKVSLPSRNWMIFWTVLASFGGAIAYDRHEQKKIREEYMEKLTYLSKVPYSSDKIPRKLSIFVAPPPNDFLDESLKYFRKYVKPFLNASAIDFEVYTESKQGELRNAIADRIRELRSKRLQEKEKEVENKSAILGGGFWSSIGDTVTHLSSFFGSKEKPEIETLTPAQDLYSPKDVIGFYLNKEPLAVKREDEIDQTHAGGVICIGRGAFKEYMNGVHEGLLGPLTPPEPTNPIEDKSSTQDAKTDSVVAGGNIIQEDSNINQETKSEESTDNTDSSTLPSDVNKDQEATEDTTSEVAQKEDEDDEENKVPKPYILPSEYAKAEFAPEFNRETTICNDRGIPVIFEQPVYTFALPKVSGFVNFPKKIYNFFTRRYVAQEAAEHTLAVIYNQIRPFEYKDKYMAGEEEQFWPKRWVQTGKEKNSEWVQELVVDEKVTSRMRVYDSSVKRDTAAEASSDADTVVSGGNTSADKL